MSIEKLSDESKVRREKIPYTQVCNNVINHIKDGDAFLVWCYLQSKSANWKVIKKDIKFKYKFGDLKLKRIFSYLNRANLIKYAQNANSDGKFEQVEILVLNGSNFDKNQPFIQEKPVGQETAPAVHRTNGFDDLLKKDITKNINKQNTKSYCASSDAHTTFEKFWSLYPRKQNKKNAFSVWVKKNLAEHIHDIELNLMKRLEGDWKTENPRFIPMPTTFLNGERWKDDFHPVSNVTQIATKQGTPRNGHDVAMNYFKKHGLL